MGLESERDEGEDYQNSRLNVWWRWGGDKWKFNKIKKMFGFYLKNVKL